MSDGDKTADMIGMWLFGIGACCMVVSILIGGVMLWMSAAPFVAKLFLTGLIVGGAGLLMGAIANAA